MPHARWPRPFHVPGARRARLEWWAFDRHPARPVALDLEAEGSPTGELPAGLGVSALVRADDPERFAEWLAPMVGDWEVAAPEVAGALRACPLVHTVVGDCDDPEDLVPLQAAWALVRGLCRSGVFVVYDVPAMRWRSAAEVLGAPMEDPSMACTFRVWVRPDPLPVEPRGIHVVHTTGLAKVARPDLVCFVPASLRAAAEHLLVILGEEQILGRSLPPDVGLEHLGFQFRTAAYSPGFNAPRADLPLDEQPLLIVIDAVPDPLPALDGR